VVKWPKSIVIQQINLTGKPSKENMFFIENSSLKTVKKWHLFHQINRENKTKLTLQK